MDTFKCVCLLLMLMFPAYCKDKTDKAVSLNVTENEGIYLQANETVNNAACVLIPTVSEICDEISSLSNAAYKLVKLKVRINGTNTIARNRYPSSVYQPQNWVITTSATGKSLLMLREYFEPMSLFTLGYGIANLDIILKQQPVNCLDNIEINQIENLLRLSILNNFGSESALPETGEVCNQHIESKGDGVAKLVYICCKNDRSQNGGIQCLENSETIWIHLLFISLFLIQLFIVAYCPLMLPNTLFKARTVFQKYVYQTESRKSLVLNVQKVDSTESVDKSFVKTRRHTCAHMTGFKQQLEGMKTGRVYSMYVKAVDLSVRESKIISDGSAPVGVMNFLFKFFIRCAIRREISSVSECCNANMCGLFSDDIKTRWYQCLRVLMLVLSSVICSSPWILRVWFYYRYEQDVTQQMMDLCNALNLSMPFNGFFVSYLSPVHPFFIAMYILLVIEVVFYFPQPDTVKRRLKFTVRKCFRDMRENSKMEACGYFVSKMLYPLTRFGIVGCLLAPFWVVTLPILVIILALNVVPIVNLTLRLFANLVFYTLRLVSPETFTFIRKNDNGTLKRWIKNRFAAVLVTDFHEQNTRINQFVHAISLIMSLLSIWCTLVLVVDCLAFYTECIVYGLIGFILNPSHAMKYVSLCLLIVVYGIECFSGVNKRYVAYGNAINAKVKAMVGERMNDVASQSVDEQVNSVFRIENEDVSEKMQLVAGSERYLKWRAPRLVLFLDSSDVTYIPKSLLMQMARLQHAVCPGHVHILYLKALVDFLSILMFLFFVFIVIFAFGQAQDISSGGQAIAALGSGFLPLILRKFLFQSHSGPSVDTSNMKWNYMFQNAIDKYKDRWNFEDIHVIQTEEAKALEPNHSDETSSANVEAGDSDTRNDNTDALLAQDEVRNVDDVDLIIKTNNVLTGDDLEFYIPVTRAADCDEDEVLNV